MGRAKSLKFLILIFWVFFTYRPERRKALNVDNPVQAAAGGVARGRDGVCPV